MDNIRLHKSLSVYYGLNGHYQTMFDIATKAKKEHSSRRSDFLLLTGIALRLMNRLDEARQEFETLHGPHKSAALVMLGESVVPEVSEYCALALLMLNDSSKCREICLKCEESLASLCFLGWSELDLKLKTASNAFDKAIKLSSKDFEANLGKAKCYSLFGEPDKSFEILNHLVVRYASSSVPLIEKMNLHLSFYDWEQALELSTRIETLNTNSIESSTLKTLKALCVDGNFEEANAGIRKLSRDIETIENKNAQVLYVSASLLSRLCCRNSAILEEVKQLAERCVHLCPNDCEFMCELAHVAMLQGKLKEAIKHYKTSVKLDSSSLTALCGLTFCQLLEKPSEAVKQQIELLKELQSSNVSPLLLYMCALVKDNDTDLLCNAIEAQEQLLQGERFGAKYLFILNPEFIFDVIKTLLGQCPRKAGKDSREVNLILKFLKPVVQSCPGLLEARILQAEALCMIGDTSTAMSQLRRFPESSRAQLLLARILVDQGDISGASKTLETALSYNFQVQDDPLYILINSKKQCEKMNFGDAIKSITSALKSLTLSKSDKISLTLELIGIYKKNGDFVEARKILQEATAQFTGSSQEEMSLTVAQADLDIAGGHLEQALATLKAILPSDPMFIESRKKMAAVFLVHKKDRRMFAACYREIVEQIPGPDTQVLLGDAYMKIQEPEKAVESYENALKRSPRNPQLVRKVAKALVQTHMFGKAINFYTESVKRDPTLRQDLAELLLKLRHFDKAHTLLKQATAGAVSSTEIPELKSRCSLLLLLARVQQELGNMSGAISTLSDARDIQTKLLRRLQVEGSESLEAERLVAASITRQMAKHEVGQGNNQDAIKLCREALNHSPDNIESLLELAQLFLQVGELSQCQTTCGQLLRLDADNETACVMMADLAFRRTDYDTASIHFKQLLARQPRFWTALARLIEVMRRSGTLSDVPPFLDRAAASGPDEPGLAYCQGLYCWYSGLPSEALKHFNRARRDAEWGRQAICSMVEICLNPDASSLGSAGVLEMPESADSRDSREAALSTAERLLAELKPRPVTEERNVYRLMCCFLALARRDKQVTETALQELAMLSGEEGSRCSVGVTLAVSTAYLILKQSTRARNQLKRVAKQTWSFEEAEYLERCWLMLADLYIQAGKLEVASELLRRALQHNKSCSKAYEYLGLITEKEQLYREAASNYEQAWRFSNRANPAIGYKLAFNLLKAKKYVDTIDVCHQVIAVCPNYPKIHKDILEKARNTLRS